DIKTPRSFARASQVGCHDDSSTVEKFRSSESVVQPAAKNPVGEMATHRDLSPRAIKGRRNDARGVEGAKVHVESFYFPRPVTRHKWQVPLRAVAQNPTGV